MPGWPPGAATFHMVQGGLFVELGTQARLGREELPEGAVEAVQPGDELRIAQMALRLDPVAAPVGPATLPAQAAGLPVEVRFTFLPTGGRARLVFAGNPRPVTVELAELRARLVASLLQPRGGYAAGDFVPDEVLAPAIWPGQAERGRVDLNLLIHRTRRDFLAAGINPSAVLARAPKGGGTAFRMAPGARLVID